MDLNIVVKKNMVKFTINTVVKPQSVEEIHDRDLSVNWWFRIAQWQLWRFNYINVVQKHYLILHIVMQAKNIHTL